MRSHKERRKPAPEIPSPYADNGRARLIRERRSGRDRRLENMRLDERQTEFSEMPGPVIDRLRRPGP